MHSMYRHTVLDDGNESRSRPGFPLVTKSTPLQAKVFALLKIDPEAAVAINRAG